MSVDRRYFLRSASFAAFGFGLVSPWMQAAAGASRLSKRVAPPNAADRSVLEFIATYSSQVRMIGAGVLARLNGAEAAGVRLLVKVEDTALLETALAGGSPFPNCLAQGNTLCFTVGDTDYVVENLVPEVFANAIKFATLKRKATFAHDALVLNPVTGEVSDPLNGAKGSVLKLVNRGSGVGEALGVLLEGWIVAAELGLRRGPDLAKLQRQVLKISGNRKGLALLVRDALAQNLPLLAGIITIEQIEEILLSRLVNTALKRLTGMNGRELIAEFGRLQALSGGDYSDAGVWLSALLGEGVWQDTLSARRGQDLPRRRGSRRALSEARQLAQALAPAV